LNSALKMDKMAFDTIRLSPKVLTSSLSASFGHRTLTYPIVLLQDWLWQSFIFQIFQFPFLWETTLSKRQPACLVLFLSALLPVLPFTQLLAHTKVIRLIQPFSTLVLLFQCFHSISTHSFCYLHLRLDWLLDLMIWYHWGVQHSETLRLR
jgi:hypothetical protein